MTLTIKLFGKTLLDLALFTAIDKTIRVDVTEEVCNCDVFIPQEWTADELDD